MIVEVARRCDRDATWAVLRVADAGIGVPASDRERVFEWLSRGENVRRTTIPGTGIGLAGVREIVAQHGGTISLESEEGHGSTFTVCLPTEPPTAPNEQSPNSLAQVPPPSS